MRGEGAGLGQGIVLAPRGLEGSEGPAPILPLIVQKSFCLFSDVGFLCARNRW